MTSGTVHKSQQPSQDLLQADVLALPLKARVGLCMEPPAAALPAWAYTRTLQLHWRLQAFPNPQRSRCCASCAALPLVCLVCD